MFYGNPRIYNGAGVYLNGGGDGLFTVDLGGGVSQTFVFPPYLVPVEYIDTTNAVNFTAMGPFNLECKNTYDIKFILSYDVANNASARPWQIVTALGETGSDVNISYTFKSDATKGTFVYTGGVQPEVNLSGFNTDTDKVTFNFSAANQKLIVTDEHGHYAQGVRNAWFYYPKWGMWSVGGLSSQGTNFPYKGKFYGLIIREGDKPLLALFPCRRTDNNMPCIVDVVSGSVGSNWTKDFDVSGVTFGPDIDLSDIGNYFQ